MTEPVKKAPAKRAPRQESKVAAAGGSGREDASENMENDEVQIPTPYPSIHELWCRVMESVRVITKDDVNSDQNFKFRGIDAVMEAVGPALREHKVHVRPRRILEHSVTEYISRGGARMVNRIVRVEWEVTGPQGDSFAGESMGEAADSSDKSLTKAQSVAYRVFLLNSLTVPTGDPDPDAETHERATPSECQQAVKAAGGGKVYRSREEYEADKRRQAQAGEENQAAQQFPESSNVDPWTGQPDPAEIEKARADMWRVAKGLGWQWGPLVERFKADHDGRAPSQSTRQELEQFAAELTREAELEEERARRAAEEQLGAKPVDDETQAKGGLL